MWGADLLGPYDRKARLYPALLVVFPLLVLLPALYGIETASLISIAGVCGIGFLLSRIARDAGVRQQQKVWASWGGPPTIQLLRHRDSTLDRLTKARYHSALSQIMRTPMPTSDEENADPAAADEQYRAAARRLIELTRDRSRFPLLLNENAAYGFQRNGRALKPVGIAVALTCMAWALWQSGAISWGENDWPAAALRSLPPPAVLSLTVSSFTLLAWLVAFTDGAMKRTAFAYSERLLECCEHVASSTTAAP